MPPSLFVSFFFNNTATTEINSLPLHDPPPIFEAQAGDFDAAFGRLLETLRRTAGDERDRVRQRLVALLHVRSEEHTSELQSRQYIVCRLLLEKKKDKICGWSRRRLVGMFA